MAQLTEIPDWIVANLSNYSKQQQAVALTWAYRNLPYDLLEKYYQWALWYRPAFNREIQDLVDRIGYRLEVERMGFSQNGMSGYIEQAPQNLGYFSPAQYPNYGIGANRSAYGGNLNVGAGAGGGEGGAQQLGQFGIGDLDVFQESLIASGAINYGISANPDSNVNVGQGGGSGQWSGKDYADLIKGITNAATSAAGSITSTVKTVDCMTNPCKPGCPGSTNPTCTGVAPNASGLATPAGQADYLLAQQMAQAQAQQQAGIPTTKGTTIGQRSGNFVWNGSTWVYSPPAGMPTTPGTTIGQRSGNFVWNGTTWVYTPTTTTAATTTVPTTPGTAVGQRYGNYVWNGTAWAYSPLAAPTTTTGLDTTTILLIAAIGIGAYFLLARKD